MRASPIIVLSHVAARRKERSNETRRARPAGKRQVRANACRILRDKVSYRKRQPIRNSMNNSTFSQYVLSLQFFARILQQSPEEAFVEALATENLFADFGAWDCFRLPAGTTLPEFGAIDPAQAAAALAACYSSAAVAGDAKAFYRDARLELHLDHLHLFSGPTPAAPPWESVWRERDRLLFGEQTEKVFAFYDDWGIRTEKSGKEPEDHLGLELAFVLFLLQTAQETPSRKSAQGTPVADAPAIFLDEHVLPWAFACLRAASENARTVFYRELAKLCAVMLYTLRDELLQNAS